MVTIPVGAAVEIAEDGQIVGLCHVCWDGQRIMTFREDILRGSIQLDELGDFALEGFCLSGCFSKPQAVV